jgi:nucleotide-binding universal stress UspA family protein
MMERMLVPLDLYGAAPEMASAVEELARLGVEEADLLYVVNIRDTGGMQALKTEDEVQLGAWRERLEACGVAVVRTEVVNGIPWIEILERIEARHPSLVVMGSHGRTLLSRMLLGSTTENVVHHSTVPVFILRLKILDEGDPATCTLATDRLFRRILFATDFSGDAERCIPYLDWMAGAAPDELVIAHVQDTRHPGYVSPEQREEFNRRDSARLRKLKEHFLARGYPSVITELTGGNAISEILGIARNMEVSTIVMGAKGRHGVAETILGGVTETVIHRAPCHVLVVR